MKNRHDITKDKHFEDHIFSTKGFINELQKVQEAYFLKLSERLKLSDNGKDWLFDYIYNTTDEESYDGFEHYLNEHKQKYSNLMDSTKQTVETISEPSSEQL